MGGLGGLCYWSYENLLNLTTHNVPNTGMMDFDYEIETANDQFNSMKYGFPEYRDIPEDLTKSERIQEFRKILERVGYDNFPKALDITNTLLYALREEGRLKEATELIDYYLKTKNISNEFYRGCYLQEKGRIEKTRGNFNESISFLIESIKYLKDHKKTLSSRVMMYEKCNFEFLYDATREDLAVSLIELAKAYLHLKKYEKAYDFSKLSLEEFYKRKEKHNPMVTLKIMYDSTLSFSYICQHLKNKEKESTCYLMRILKYLSSKPTYKNLFRKEKEHILSKIATRFYLFGYEKTSLKLNKRALDFCETLVRRVELLYIICSIYYNFGNFEKFFETHETRKEIPTMSKIRKIFGPNANKFKKQFKYIEELKNKMEYLAIKGKTTCKISSRRFCESFSKDCLEKRNICSTCGIRSKKVHFRKCSVCKVFFYCSVDCQKKDWKEYHKDCCIDFLKI